tara:strand:+ start:123 stop:461 length:339 start_codon:yes stop_codon:yes gene_type:complete
MGVEFALSVTEIIRENQTASRDKRTKGSLNQVFGSVLTLRAAYMAENCEVIALVFDLNSMKVTRPPFDSIGKAETLGVGSRNWQYLMKVIYERCRPTILLQNCYRPRSASGP